MAGLVLCAACASGFAGAPARSGDEASAGAASRIRTGVGADRLVLLGETHGTREIPDLVASLVADYAAEGPVLLALEMPRSEHAALSQYLISDGGDAARAALRATAFWTVTGNQHDGRRSEDMLDLIEAVRALRDEGRDVAFVPYDVERGFDRVDGDARDAAMARHVRAAYAALPRGRLLVLAGNVHAMLRKPEHAPAQMPVPMGEHLHDLAPYSARIDARAGQSWACRDARCGPLPVVAMATEDGAPTGIFARVYDLQVLLPSFTIARLLGTASPR